MRAAFAVVGAQALITALAAFCIICEWSHSHGTLQFSGSFRRSPKDSWPIVKWRGPHLLSTPKNVHHNLENSSHVCTWPIPKTVLISPQYFSHFLFFSSVLLLFLALSTTEFCPESTGHTNMNLLERKILRNKKWSGWNGHVCWQNCESNTENGASQPPATALF